MESYCKGEKDVKDSVNDDLESLFENIRLGKEPNERVCTYFLPRLTEEELKLVKRGDRSYLGDRSYWDPDVDETKMMLSKLDSDPIAPPYSEPDTNYVQGESRRRTFVIKDSSELLYDNSSKKKILKQPCLKNCEQM